MFARFYGWLHRMISRPRERGEYSSGYWPDLIRKEALIFCRGIRGRALEVGCGEGLFLTQLARANPELGIWGVDNDLLRLNEAAEKLEDRGLKNITLSAQDALNLSFEDEYFDTVVCINVFFNMDSVTAVIKALKEMKRVSKKSGRIIFDFRSSLNPALKAKYKLARYYDPTVKNLSLNTYSPGQIEKILKDLNLKIVSRKFIGAPFKRLAPVILLESEKD